MPIAKNDGFSPVTSKRAPEIVYEKIFNMISQGDLKPRDKLPSEREMMDLFKRSHGTIREALGMLETDRYITITPGGGAYVNEITLQPIVRPLVELISYRKVTLRETLEFVREAETDFAKNFCKKRTAGNLSDLKNTLDIMKRDAEKKPCLEQLVFDFHKQLVNSLSNPVADIIWEAIGLLLINGNRPVSWLQNLDKGYVLKIHHTMAKDLSSRNSAALQKSLSDFWIMVLHSHFLNSPNPEGNYIFDLEHNDSGVFTDENGMTPFKVPKISDIVFNQIKMNILNGNLQEGERLPPERDLIKSFKCSRPSVREALRKLENNGYISITQGSGTIINEINSAPLERSLQNVINLKLITSENLQEIRNVCDSITAVWAAANHNAQDLDSIQAILDDTLAVLDIVDQTVILSREFHARIALAAHNQLSYIISRIIWAVIFDRILAHVKRSDPVSARAVARKDYAEHKALFEAIRAGDITKTKTTAISHIKFVKQQID
jgi:DNA-binding FadR family transcriptional regulator